MSTPRRVGVNILFYCCLHQCRRRRRLQHQSITKGPPAQIFLVAFFLFPRSLAFNFCYDLDIWGQGQALRAFFVVMSFFAKSMREILIKHGRNLHRHLAHDLIMVSYICLNSIGPNLPVW